MAKNLKYQFLNAIESGFREGMDKHSLKHSEGTGNGRVFSYSDRRNMIDFGSNFANYMRENYADVKMARDVKTEHIQSFLNAKAETCTTDTVKQYQSKFAKLEQLVNKRYKTEVDYHTGLVRPTGSDQTHKLRDVAMSKQDYQKLSSRLEQSKSASALGIQLAARTGMRVGELTKLQKRDIDLENSKIKIIGKGGKTREIEIKEKDKDFFEKVKNEIKNDTDRVVPVRPDTINQFLKRQLEKENDLENDYTAGKTGIHSIRKMAAQDHYDELRNEGFSMAEAWSNTSVWLGHGPNREELFAVYVKNRW